MIYNEFEARKIINVSNSLSSSLPSPRPSITTPSKDRLNLLGNLLTSRNTFFTLAIGMELSRALSDLEEKKSKSGRLKWKEHV